MKYVQHYASPLGGILMAADDEGLTGLWFEGQKYVAANLEDRTEEKDLPVFCEVGRWLDIYFSGKEPDFLPQIHMIGTAFQKRVWKILCEIPYGKTMTYGDIANLIAADRGLEKMSAQAVGHNPIAVVIPCHRVVGTSGSLTGYAGGMGKKTKLLKLESVDMTGLFIPTKGTAL